MPLRPSRSACQKVGTSWPRAQITPMPVMATRRISGRSARAARGQGTHALNHFAHAANRLRLLVGDGYVERALDLEQNIHAVERVNAQLLEGALGRHALPRN